MKTGTLKTRLLLILSALGLFVFLTHPVAAGLLNPGPLIGSWVASAQCDPVGPDEPDEPNLPEPGPTCHDANEDPVLLCSPQDWFLATSSGCIPSDDFCYPSQAACEMGHGAGNCRTLANACH